MNQDAALNDIELDSDLGEASVVAAADANQDNVDNAKLSIDSVKDRGEEAEKKDEEQEEEDTWWNTAYKVGENILYVADFLGEVFAEFFGMTQSRYQWAIDAYERQQRWDKEEKQREEYHKKMLMEEVARNRKHKKKNKQQGEIERNLNQNDITLSINKTDGVDAEHDLEDGTLAMHEEEIRVKLAETNKNDGMMYDDGKEEEEPEIQETMQRNSNDDDNELEDEQPRNVQAEAIEVSAAN